MNNLRLAFAALVIIFSALPATAQVEFKSIDAFLKATLKGNAQLNEKALGDLNGDGLKDWAGVIHRREEDSSPTYQLYVLLRLRQGGYQVAEKSIEEEIPGMGCCWVESLEIRRASIYIQSNAKSASVMEAVTHQFKLYKDEWRLIGIKTYYTDFTSRATATIDTEMNLVAGTVTEKSQKGRRKPVTKSSRKKFDIFLLKNFDFSTRFGNEEG
jgi:hypothetical protein